jgi:hypothetical protein
MKNRILYILVSGLLIIGFTACEEVVEIDLNSSNPVIVAEGYLNKDSTAVLNLSYTTDYFHSETPVLIEDAIVTLEDDKGNLEILTHLGGGYYRGSTMRGEASTDYTLTMEIEDEVVSGTSRLLSPPAIESMYYGEALFQRPSGPPGSPPAMTSYAITLNIHDDPMEDNYFLMNFSTSTSPPSFFYLTTSDEFVGAENSIQFSTFMFEFYLGDTVNIELYSIDGPTYWYYNQLNDAVSMGPAMSSTPYNPKSNFGENVLGYFMARSKMDTSVVIR